MKLTPSEAAFLEDLARAAASWTSGATAAISNPNSLIWSENSEAWLKLSSCIRASDVQQEFALVVSELLSGLVHSVLV